MAPAYTVPDIWSETLDQEDIMVDVLLPNGYLMNMKLNKAATLVEVKEEVWDAAQHCPLFGLLRDSDSYVFQCINAATAERDELVDEEKRLCDVKPFQAILRLVEREGDNAEKILNSKIRFVIGKGLHEFDQQKDPEVNDFRKQMRLFCEQISQQQETDNWEKKLLFQHPVCLESQPRLPQYLQSKLRDGHLVLSITMEQHSSGSTFKLSVPSSINSKELFDTILSKKGPSIGLLHRNSLKSYLLKICGLEEYLIGPHPLSQYKYIQECLSCDKIPALCLISSSAVRLETSSERSPAQRQKLERQRTRSMNEGYSTLPKRKKPSAISTWTVDEPFTLTVHYIHKLNCDRIKVAVQAGLYHGDEVLCSAKHTSDQTLNEDGACVWEETLRMDIDVQDLPRMAKLCFCVYEFSPTQKNTRFRKLQGGFANPIAWVNTAVFDYKGVLKTVPFTLYTWSYSQESDDYDSMLRPLGWSYSNPNKDRTAALTLSYGRYHPFSQLLYPGLEKILEYAKVASNENGSNNLTPQASKSYVEQLRQICEKDSLYQLHEQEKELLWFLRNHCCNHLPNSLPKLLRSLKWHERKDVAQMTALLQIWPRLEPDKALELLDYAYPDQTVRSFAVDCLKNLGDEELSLYLLQLVQALKHEPYLQSDLVKFLLQRSLVHRHSGHRFFWLLRSEMHFPEVSIRFGLILEAYCRGATSHMAALAKQVEALTKLQTANKMVQNDNFKKKDGREKLKCLIQETLSRNSFQDTFCDLQNPLDPRYKFGKMRVEKCKFLDSKMKPLWLVFENTDIYGKDIFIIFKNGDDLRQDMLTLQMIRIMDKLWKDEGLDLRMIPYQCMATDHKVGLIEVVPNADTIANIQKEKGFTATSAFKKGSILSWLKDHNSDETSLGKAAEEFTLSCAGYCVATYVLGVADRHSDNIMVKTNGQLFHVDFGHILGKFKEKFGFKRERVPFVLTHDFVYIITKGHTQKSQEFQKFQQYCERAFSILRRKGSLMISLFAMMLSTGIPELSSERDLDYLRETLVLDMTEQEALKHFRSKFDEALKNSWKTSVNWMAHNWTRDNKMTD